MKKILFITLILSTIFCANSLAAVPITFIKSNPQTTLGIAKFILNEKGEKVDYEILNIRWTDKVKTINLGPGVYGITEYKHWRRDGYIVNYIEIEVKEGEPKTIIF